ncbi:MAG: UDP-4-amino-4,6-dideoxy-N-acetyl-beta-L-altrosamine transaminase [Burkholderiales bacterium]|nr:UDP-4-amino-4,6-dideoxy-N-acetyl-beta-L-altrosamine transaminase [Burkholderiales bacterium]
MIPYGRQDIREEDIDAVVSVLKSDFLTQGPMVPAFENRVASHVGSKFAVAVNSATSALHIACLALDLQKGDVLWTTPITFVASANCALYCGAAIDFVDINPKTYNISVEKLEEKLIFAQSRGILPKILVAVHLCGEPCEMEKISALSKKYGFKIIEDASHAIGGKYKNSFIGSNHYSDITVFSFHPVKIITTAEGGMALTNNALLDQRLRLLRSHGITRDEASMTHQPDGPWYYQQIELGYNYRMTELQAALGLSQMDRLDLYVQTRHQLAKRYQDLLRDLPLSAQQLDPESYSGLHLYVIRLDKNAIKNTHLEVFNDLRASGIGVNLHYIPVHLQPYYKKLGFTPNSYPEAEKYYSEAISIPLYYGMSESQQDQVVQAISKAVGA